MSSIDGGSAAPSASDVRGAIGPVIQNATPTTGQTVNCTATAQDLTVVLTPAGTLAALTVTLPADGATAIGQIIRICTTQAITAFTINGATTIRNVVVSAIVNDCSTYQKVAANTWMRLL